MDINDVLRKNFFDLTKEEQVQISKNLVNRIMSDFRMNNRQGIFAATQKLKVKKQRL